MKDIVDKIMDLFSFALEKASYDMKDHELQKETYRKKIIKIFESDDKL